MVSGGKYYLHCCTSLKLACVSGGYLGVGKGDSEDILEYRDGDGWRKIGTMKIARENHGQSLVKYEKFEQFCG